MSANLRSPTAHRWLAASVILVIVLGVMVFRSTNAAPRHVALRFVRPDGQPLESSESGDHEVVLASGCGVERWPVKTAADADRAKISTSRILVTSIASLSSRA